MCRNQSILHIRPNAHLVSGAEQNTHLALADFLKQCFFCLIRIRVMNVRNLLRLHALSNQLCANIVIDVEASVLIWRRLVTEDQLCGLLLARILIDLEDILHTAVHLAVRIVRQLRIQDAAVQGQFAAFVRDLEHVVILRQDTSIPDELRTIRQLIDHRLLFRRRRQLLNDILTVRNVQMNHVRRLDVSDFLEHAHEFRQVVELREPCFFSEAFALRADLGRQDGLPEG